MSANDSDFYGAHQLFFRRCHTVAGKWNPNGALLCLLLATKISWNKTCISVRPAAAWPFLPRNCWFLGGIHLTKKTVLLILLGQMVKDNLHKSNTICYIIHSFSANLERQPIRNKHLVLKTAVKFDWSEGGMVIPATDPTNSCCAADLKNSALKHGRHRRNWNVKFANPIHTSLSSFLRAICIIPHFINQWFTKPN